MLELFNHLTDKEAAIVAQALKILVKAIEEHYEEPPV
jgi:hypothetical protein